MTRNLTQKNAKGACGIRWDLSDLYVSLDDPKIDQDLKAAKEKAVAFEKRHKEAFSTYSSFPPSRPDGAGEPSGRPPLGQPARKRESGKQMDPRLRGDDMATFNLLSLIRDYVEIVELSTKPAVYAMLLFSSDTAKPEYGAFVQKTMEAGTDIRSHCLFWELMWSRLDEKTARAFLERKELEPYRHYLKKLRDCEPHLLAEGEEKIIDIKDNTGSRAFSRLFDEVMNGITFTVTSNGKAEEKTESEILAMLHLSDRSARREGHRSLTDGLKQNSRMLTYIFNMIFLDHKSSSKIRRFEHPMASRNLANEVSLAAVENLIRTVKAAYPAVVRYYRLKKRMLGLDELFDYDRYAPVGGEERDISFDRARELVSEAYYDFDPSAGQIVDRFFENKWIDAEPRPGKRGGAFSCATTPDLHPYVLTNYTGRVRDVMTLAHELGHGIHQYLSRGVGILEADAPLTMAECASVFGEMLAFGKLMQTEKNESLKLGLVSAKIEDCFATVFRQIVMTDFELKCHTAVAERGELATDVFSGFWMDANRPMHGEAVTLTSEYRLWWMYIPHFIHTPFYCYAYAFAQLLVLCMYRAYRSDRQRFIPNYLKLLSLGGSKTPEELCRLVGLDITNPDFWKSGLSLIDQMVEEAERLYSKVHA